LVEHFSPCKSLEEKLNSLKSADEVTSFENNLLTVIGNKKEEKLQVIINDAISKIEKEIGDKTDIKLGINSDFKNLLGGMIDPDKIEEYKIKVLKLIEQQKSESNERISVDSNLKKDPPFS